MKFKRSIYLFTIILISFSACKKVPLTGRKQLILLSESEVRGMALTSYNEFLTTNKVVSNSTDAERVKTIGNKIAIAVAQYMQQKGLSESIAGYKWEFNLVEDKTVNAWCMPGGKVVIYTGILPVCKDDNGLAVVMGHEIAHAIAQHSNERMSQQYVQQFGAMGVDVAMSQKPQQTRELANVAFGIGSTVLGTLPFSRTQESEADRIGLTFMAMAGYDPKAAPEFWKRMSAQSGKQSGSDFLSTHPSDEKRIANIQKYLPEALVFYNK